MKLLILSTLSFFLTFLIIFLIIRNKLREKEITSYATQSLYIFIINKQSISNAQIEKVIYEMQKNNMCDISTATILFRLLEKSDKKPISDDVEVMKYIEFMSRKYKGQDKPFLDYL